VPLRHDRSSRRARLLLALGDHPDDVTLAHDGDHAGHRARGGIVERAKLRAACRRTDHHAPRHAREANVGDERRFAGDDVARFQVRDRPAGVPPTLLRHEGDLGRDGAGERLGVEQLRVRHPLVAANDDARLRFELLHRESELRARAFDQLMPCERRRLAEERRLLRYRVAPEGPEIERHLVGVSEDDVYALDGDVQLVCDDLREGGPDALAELDLARKRGDAAV